MRLSDLANATHQRTPSLSHHGRQSVNRVGYGVGRFRNTRNRLATCHARITVFLASRLWKFTDVPTVASPRGKARSEVGMPYTRSPAPPSKEASAANRPLAVDASQPIEARKTVGSSPRIVLPRNSLLPRSEGHGRRSSLAQMGRMTGAPRRPLSIPSHALHDRKFRPGQNR